MKKNLDIANAILSQLLTLNTALLGGSVLFLSSELTIEFARWAAMLFFLIALVICFIGILPYEAEVDLRRPNLIKDHKNKALTHKRGFIYGTAITTALGFGCALAGVALK